MVTKESSTRPQDVIAEGIEWQASWRAQKAADYPDDLRNTHAAAGLVKLAEYVRQMPNNDPRIQLLDQVAVKITGGDVFSPGSETERIISRFCFTNDPTPPTEDECSSFLDGIAEDAEREHIAILRFGGVLDDVN